MSRQIARAANIPKNDSRREKVPRPVLEGSAINPAMDTVVILRTTAPVEMVVPAFARKPSIDHFWRSIWRYMPWRRNSK